VLKACYNKTETKSLKYLFYKIRGILAITALFVKANADSSISSKIKTFYKAKIIDLVKYIYHKPRNDSISL